MASDIVQLSDGPAAVSDPERQVRIDLAAAYQLAALKGWNSLITNHFTVRVPDQKDMFLVKPHDLLFEEVTSSSLMKLPIDGPLVDASKNVNPAAFAIHTAIMLARADVNCVLHVPTDAGTAMSAHKVGLRPLNQGAMRFYNRLSYHDYEGPSGHVDERERLARSLGSNYALMMRNHGLLVCGPTVQKAFYWLGALITACRVQLMIEATGAELTVPRPEACEKFARAAVAIDDNPNVTGPMWPAELRRLERAYGASYRD